MSKIKTEYVFCHFYGLSCYIIVIERRFLTKYYTTPTKRVGILQSCDFAEKGSVYDEILIPLFLSTLACS